MNFKKNQGFSGQNVASKKIKDFQDKTVDQKNWDLINIQGFQGPKHGIKKNKGFSGSNEVSLKKYFKDF